MRSRWRLFLFGLRRGAFLESSFIFPSNYLSISQHPSQNEKLSGDNNPKFEIIFFRPVLSIWFVETFAILEKTFKSSKFCIVYKIEFSKFGHFFSNPKYVSRISFFSSFSIVLTSIWPIFVNKWSFSALYAISKYWKRILPPLKKVADVHPSEQESLFYEWIKK